MSFVRAASRLIVEQRCAGRERVAVAGVADECLAGLLEAVTVAEYRLAELREAIDERRVGFPAAYSAYEQLTSR